MMNDTEGVETSNIYFFYASETHMYTRVHSHAPGHTQRKKKGLVSQIGEKQRLRDLIKNVYSFSTIYC